MKLVFYFLLFIISFSLYSKNIGRLVESHKSVFKIHKNRTKPMKKFDLVFPKDTIKTIENSAKLLFNDSTTIVMGKSTKLEFDKYNINKQEDKRIVVINLKSGSFKLDMKEKFKTNNYSIKTDILSINVNGSASFILSSSKVEGVELFVLSGMISVTSNFLKFSNIKISENKKLSVKDKYSTFEIKDISKMEKNTLDINYKTINKKLAKKNNFKNVSKEDAVEDSKNYIAQMRALLKNAFIALKGARKEKNLLKVNCINDNVMTIKAYLRRSEDDKLQIDKSNDLKYISNALSKIHFALSNSKQATVAIKSCMGEVLKYENKDSVSIDIEKISADNDDSIKNDIVFRPVPISPFF